MPHESPQVLDGLCSAFRTKTESHYPAAISSFPVSTMNGSPLPVSIGDVRVPPKAEARHDGTAASVSHLYGGQTTSTSDDPNECKMRIELADDRTQGQA